MTGLVNAADLQLLLADAEGSRALLGEAEAWATRIDSASGLHRARVDAALARWALAVGDAPMAVERARASLASRLKVHQAAHPDRLESLRLTGLADLAAGRREAARESMETVHRLRVETLPSDHPDRIEAELDLAALDLATGEPGPAGETLRRLVDRGRESRSLAADLSRAQAARCLATHASPVDAPRYWQQADRLLAPYLDAGHPLRQPGSDRCPGFGWLAAPVVTAR